MASQRLNELNNETPNSGTYSSGTYLHTLPKDIIGYLRGFTGPDPLYQIRYQIRQEKDDGNTHMYSMFATTLQVCQEIEAIIESLNLFERLQKFRVLNNGIPANFHQIGVDTRREWGDPIKTINIGGRLHMVIPMKLHIPQNIFKTTAEFKKRFWPPVRKSKSRRTGKRGVCHGVECKKECPKELDYCWECLESVRDTKRHNPGVKKRKRTRTPPKFHAVRKAHKFLPRRQGGLHRFYRPPPYDPTGGLDRVDDPRRFRYPY